MENDNFLKKIWLFFLDFIETIVIALAIFVVIYRFLFQPHQVKGNSMYDNFLDGEYLLTNKIVYQLHEPQLSDIIVFRAPKNEEYDYIKRIVGLPGDRIMVKNDRVYVNGELFDESTYLDADIPTRPGSYIKEGLTITVPQDSYLAFGDNRNNSSDSREWGVVPKENIVGKAWIIYWPLNKIGVVEKYPNLQ
ncbi:MAG: signal peptidase I [Candidatus Beckwithbacteria bacterium]|nr:signal peptidase I [Patescibacteria group bacterium]